MKSAQRLLIYILTLSFLLGCGMADKEVESVIVQARSHLTAGQCNEAIAAISSIPYQHSNWQYIKVYSTAYACRSGFNMVKFFDEDIDKIGDPSFFGGFASFSTSRSMSDPRHETFEDLQEAIDALLYAGGLERYRNPTVERRKAVFKRDDLREIHSLMLYLSLAQLGKFLYFYGNSDVIGNKGQGAGSNTCLLSYDGTISLDSGGTLGDYLTQLGNNGNPCSGGSTAGHPSLNISGGQPHLRRACQGVVILNTFLMTIGELIDVIDDLVDLGSISDVLDEVDLARVLATGASSTIESNVLDVTSQKVCEERNRTNTRDLQIYYALFFETLFE